MAGEGGSLAVSPLPGDLLRQHPLERDLRDQAGSHKGSNRGAQSDLHSGSSGGRAGVPDRIPPAVTQIWMSFCGIPAAQRVQDYFLWEALLNEETQCRGIVELGTWEGGFSLYLAVQAENRGLFFRTYDVAAPDRRIPGFVQLDIYAEAEAIGEHLSRNDPLVLFCDGGNKPRELKTFSRYLTRESVIVVHDWNTEIFLEDVPDNVEMIYEDFCKGIDSMSRAFRVKK